MASGKGIRAGKAFVELATKDDALTRGLRNASAKLKAWGASVASMGKKFLAAGLGGATALGLATKLLVDYGSELTDMSARTGVSIDSLASFKFAAEQTGASLEDVEGGVRKMQKSLVEAVGGSQEARKALEGIGLSVERLAGMSPDEQFRAVSTALAAVPNPANRTAAAMAIMGKSATKLLPMMQELAEQEARFKELGLGFSAADAKKADDLGDSFDELTAVLKRTAMQVAIELAPALKNAFRWMAEVTSKAIAFVRENKGLVFGVTAVTAALIVLGTTLIAVGFGMTSLAAAITTVIGAGAALASPFVAIPLAFVAGAAGAALFGVALVKLTGQWGRFTSAISSVGGLLKSTFSGVADALSVGDFELAWKNALVGMRTLWLQATLNFKLKWLDVKDAVENGALGMGQSIATAMATAFTKVGDLWAKMIDGLKVLWATMANGIAVVLINAVANGAKQVLGLIRKVPFIGDKIAGGAEGQIDDAATKAIGAVAQNTTFNPTANPLTGLAGEASLASGALGEVAKKDAAARNKERQNLIRELNASEDSLTTLQEQAKAKAEAAGLVGPVPPPVEAAQRKFESIGTFSAAAARGLGAGGELSTIASNTAATTKAVKDLNRNKVQVVTVGD